MTAKATCFSTQRREDTKILKYFKVALADVSKLFIIRTQSHGDTKSYCSLCLRDSVFNTIYIIR